MKTLKIFLAFAVLLISAEKINPAGAEINHKDILISTHEALQSFVQYLKKQLNKYGISLVQDQINSIVSKSRNLIYENAHNGKISQLIERKIEKDFKIYLKNAYPDKFKVKYPQNEIYYKQAKNRIRAIIKDFIINKQKITNPTQVNETWNQVKETAYTKINKAAFLNTSRDLVVDESIIPEISSRVFAKLEAATAQRDAGNPARKRKALFPEKVSLFRAEKIVRSMIRKTGINARHSDSLTTSIMQKIGQQSDKRGSVEKTIVISIAREEIDQFKKIQESVVKPAPEGSYLDAFIRRLKRQFYDPDALSIEF
jgi:hypothetical protein